MATVISHNILSPLGLSSEATFLAVKQGKSSLRQYQNAFGTPLTITASLFSEEQRKAIKSEGFTMFESAVIHSVREALKDTDIDVSAKETCLIISTTKANINDFGNGGNTLYPGEAAKKIAEELGFTTMPIVVSNACISGVSALITASRLIDDGEYRNIIVCGCDILGKFTVSGFDSLKALSPDECRPFDEERIGLNLGEAAATIILSATGGRWKIDGGAVNNDAYHISTPSPKGTGSGMALNTAVAGREKTLAFVNVHGTATMYNDQMEWKALEAAGLKEAPVNALKGYFGHTMGAAGILECILSMSAVDNGIILGTRGFSASGVSGNVNISSENRETDKKAFVKLISGFGGCNGAIYFSSDDDNNISEKADSVFEKISNIKINGECVSIDGKPIETKEKGKALLTELYKKYFDGYPKFYKMDILSRLGFIATGILYRNNPQTGSHENIPVLLFNHSSSICSDREFISTIEKTDDFFPSPSVFVYTLPNIVNGEIALYNKTTAETAFYILPERNDKEAEKIIAATISHTDLQYCIAGWIESTDDNSFEADIKLIKKI